MVADLEEVLSSLQPRWREAVTTFWSTRDTQRARQHRAGRSDAGARSAVTGGKQMDGFLTVIARLLRDAGIPDGHVIARSRLELPGFYRATKEWDLLVVGRSQLIAVVEAKSHVGPSFSNNFNNRTEEAIGSATDLWTAFREGAFNTSVRPWLGYLFLLEDSFKSQSPVKVREPHFEVLKEFKGASYARRYELFCRKLVRERLYDCAAFVLSDRRAAETGEFTEPAGDLTLDAFARSLTAYAVAYT